MQSWGPELAIILGIVEGLTEYLPISSTGHLILVGHWLGFTGETAASVEISIQFGAILAVIVYERHKLASFLSRAATEQASLRSFCGQGSWTAAVTQSMAEHKNLWFLIGLFVAFLPAAVVGLLSHHWIETHLFNPRTVAIASIVGGLIIMVVEAMQKEARVTQLEQIGVKMAWWVGVAQCVALIPGTSRSGATIIGALLAGMDRKTATEYSFFLALPTLLAATGYKLVKSAAVFSPQDLLALGLGMIVAFLVAWAVIAGFLNFVKRHSLLVFAYYRIAMGLLVLWIFP
ncbi:MAG: undecaprenyl-diphosphate phosphatase [Nitrospiraceae bacterium]|nr:undecaprenyl-diphosphate phosphatase [Nitrospiraceae bacterium]MSR23802.1 undecaprenyl-diphosphate phosphatase [Nitrospiraceae bacterium]